MGSTYQKMLMQMPSGMEPKPEPSMWQKLLNLVNPPAQGEPRPGPATQIVDPQKAADFVKGFNR